jgi:Putative amidoligase enzyme
MILYKQDPTLPLITVTTISGEVEYRKNCRKKNENYYVIDKDIVQIDGDWYIVNDSYATFDHEKKCWVLRNKVHNLCNGVIGFDKETKTLTMGFFTKNYLNNVIVSTEIAEHYAINASVLEGSGFVEELGSGKYKKGLRNNVIRTLGNNQRFGYNIEDNGMQFLIQNYNSKQYNINLNHAKIANLLNGVTFGIELEACAGNMPIHLLNRCGLSICRDGSLIDKDGVYAPEYVTIPLSGAKGVSNVVEMCDHLQKRNKIDYKCAYHLHIGGIETSRLFLVSLHSLCYKIQGNLFKMFPHYKLKPEGFKEKNYCKLLPKVFKRITPSENFGEYVNTSYNELYKYLTEDTNGKKEQFSATFNRKTKRHNGRYKWDRVSRYHWLNMVNVFFSHRNTLEFRVHTPTFNATKIINWLLICNAICKYAQKYPLKCLDNTKISLEEVLNYYAKQNSFSTYNSFISRYLNTYVAERKAMFAKDKKEEDYLSNHELATDSNYEFIFEGIKLV